MFHKTFAVLLMGAAICMTDRPALAQVSAPDTLILRMSTDVLSEARADKSIKEGDLAKVIALVDTKVMPHVDFQRMTASAVGRYWRSASASQQQRLEEAFKILLVRTYSGALAQVQDQMVDVKPMRGTPSDNEVVVRTEVKGRGDPIQLDYRLEQTPVGWKIYDVNVWGCGSSKIIATAFPTRLARTASTD